MLLPLKALPHRLPYTRLQKAWPCLHTAPRPACRARRARVEAGKREATQSQEEGDEEDVKSEEIEKATESDNDFDPEAFSLATAVALGCCSFEAYNAPYKHYGLKEVSPCGTEIVFMDRDFLASRFHGILEVHLRRAIGLPEVEQEEGKREIPSPRCRVTVFPSSGFSEKWEKSVDPRWRQTFFLYVRDPEHQQLEVSVEHITDQDEEPNIELGSVTWGDLQELCDGEIHDLEVELHSEAEGSSAGKIQLSVRYQVKSEENDLIGSIKEQAIGQMMTDDWSHVEPEEWDVVASNADWRFTGVPTLERPKVADEGAAFDIEGGQLVEGQPLDREPWKAWTEFREAVLGRQLFASVSPLVFLMNKESDSEVWIYRNSEERRIVISFRGTSSPKDMLTDVALDLAAFNPGGNRESKAPEEVASEMSEEELENGPMGGLYKSMKTLEKMPGAHLINQIIKKKAKQTGGRDAPKGLSGWAKAQMMMIYAIEHDEMWCHKGFLQAYQAVSDVILRVVDEILEGKGKKETSDEKQEKEAGSWFEQLRSRAGLVSEKIQPEAEWHIYTTGHSMGGAMATLCAHELAVRDYGLFSAAPKVTMYSFGQPRVGNGPFAKQYDQDVPDSWRVKNSEDMVTRVPSLLGYQHIGAEVNLFPHGKVTITPQSLDDVREGAVLTDLLPKIKGGITGEDEELSKELKELVKGEVDVFKALLKGEGINQHMEDVYHEYLHGCSNSGSDFCQPVISAVEEAKREAAEHQKNKSKRKK